METIADAPLAAIAGPEDPALAPLWTLALAKFEVAEGRNPATRADWRRVTRTYGQLLRKRHASLGVIVRELQTAPPPGGG